MYNVDIPALEREEKPLTSKMFVLFPLLFSSSKLLPRYRTRGKKKAQFHIKVQLNGCLSVHLLFVDTCHVTPVLQTFFFFFF